MKLLGTLAISAGVVALIAAVALWIALRNADGPIGPLPGGELRTGELLEESEVDWDALLAGVAVVEVELQLLEPKGSRTTGAFVYGGDLYVPVDLGYVWRRVPDPVMRNVLRLIWLLKSWHRDAERDGRVVLRLHGKRYERTAVRVSDPPLLAAFREHVERAAGEALGELLPVETDPADIWFFRMDPRS